MSPLTVPELLAARRHDAADIECFVADGHRLTYRDLDERSAVLARRLLDAGIGAGSRVGLVLPNDVEFVCAWFAITRIGAVAVPISTLSTSAELHRILRHASVHLVLTIASFRHHSFVQRLDEAAGGITGRSPLRIDRLPRLREVWMWGDELPTWATAIDDDRQPKSTPSLLAEIESTVTASDDASIISTSGSTAEPKGVVHTHGTLMRAAAKCRDSYDQRPGDRTFTQMPLFWVGGLTVNLLAGMTARATMLTSASAAPSDVLELLERERATNVMAWPHLARAIASDPSFDDRDLSSVRLGSLHEALAPEHRPRDPSLMNSALGMTETAGPHTIASTTELPEARRGSFGPPQPGMQHRVVDPASGDTVPDGEIGELHVRGDTLMAGLVGRERSEVFDADGWYRTGDLVSRRDGEFHFHGRLDDLIKSAGANVSPREVEQALLTVPTVVAATVTSVDDPLRGAVVGAAVVSADALLDVDTVRDEVKRVLSAYKVPRVMVVLSPAEVPLMSSGKVDRRAIIEILRGAAAARDESPVASERAILGDVPRGGSR